jgi:CelD/BcsL family acetyltransferase involved in cellulose biosynthesis
MLARKTFIPRSRDMATIDLETVPENPRREATEIAKPFSDEALFLTDAPVPGLSAPQRQEEGTLQVESVREPQRLAALAPEWQQLADRAAEPNPFFEPWMLMPALRHFGKGAVEVLFVSGEHPSRIKGKRLLCGVLPIVSRRGRIEAWRYPYCYLSAPILRRGYERRCIAALLDTFRARAQLVRIEDLPGDGPLRTHLVDELNARGWPSVIASTYTRAILKRAATSEDYLSRAVAGKRRKEWRRQRSRLAEMGALRTQETDDQQRFVSEFCTLEAAGWKGREKVDAARDRSFIEELAEGAAQAKRQQLLALRLDDKPLALKWNLFAGEAAFAFKITFDETFARFSPGVQLELDNVERAHQRPGLRFMDSCAAPNRFMINHLWPDRREMQTLFFSTGRPIGSLVIATVPLVHFARRFARGEQAVNEHHRDQ